jgi:isocitrate dehydrogenase
MLVHIGAPEVASNIENAWLKTLEDGIHTGDIYSESNSNERVGTEAFAEAVIARLGQNPKTFAPAAYVPETRSEIVCVEREDSDVADKQLIGADVYLDNTKFTAAQLAEMLSKIESKLQLKVWPADEQVRNCSDCWRCRFMNVQEPGSLALKDITRLMDAIDDQGLQVIRMQALSTFDGERGFTLAQGQ